MKRSLSLLAVLLTVLSPLFADQPADNSSAPKAAPLTLEEQSQSQNIADQLAPLYKEQFHCLRSNDMPYQVYEGSDSDHKLSLRDTWGHADGLFDERKNENFSNPANTLDALGQEYALHLNLIKMSYGIGDESNTLDQIASTSLSASDFALFNDFEKRLPQFSAGDPYDMENHDATVLISNEELCQHPLPNIVAMEVSFLKMELLSLLKDMEFSKGSLEQCDEFIQSLDNLPVDSYNDLVAAQHKMVDLEKELRAPLSASGQQMKSMEAQERGLEMWNHVNDSDRVTNTEKRQDSFEKKSEPDIVRKVEGICDSVVNGHPILMGSVWVGTGIITLPIEPDLSILLIGVGAVEIGRGVSSAVKRRIDARIGSVWNVWSLSWFSETMSGVTSI